MTTPVTRSPSLLPTLLALAVGMISGCIIYDRTGEHGDWCSDEYHVCSDSSDCHFNQHCMRGLCHDMPLDARACGSSRDCASGEHCINSLCSKTCSRDADCPSGTTCD
ncbi:MAG TPA: hypothetical protein VLQ93_16355, partial [Myxococcaceae bacterium]|nr:hypothetical protein [Myxococcaceae bacterium]